MAWHVDYIPADFTAIVMGLRAVAFDPRIQPSEACREETKMIAHGRDILRQLKRRKVRLPNPAIVDRWKRELKAHKKHCKR